MKLEPSPSVSNEQYIDQLIHLASTLEKKNNILKSRQARINNIVKVELPKLMPKYNLALKNFNTEKAVYEKLNSELEFNNKQIVKESKEIEEMKLIESKMKSRIIVF